MGDFGMFLADLERLTQHCEAVSHRSDVRSYVDCDPFRALAGYGRDAVPFLQTARSVFPGLVPGIAYTPLLAQLVGEPLPDLPENLRGRIAEMNLFYSRWCDANLERFA